LEDVVITYPDGSISVTRVWGVAFGDIVAEETAETEKVEKVEEPKETKETEGVVASTEVERKPRRRRVEK